MTRKLHSAPLSGAEKQRRYRAKMRAESGTEVIVRVHADDAALIRRYAEVLRAKRKLAAIDADHKRRYVGAINP